MKVKVKDKLLYAFVGFERKNPYYSSEPINDTGYVTKSILKSDQFKNKRVRVMGSNGNIYYPIRKQITTIIPFRI